MTTLSATMSMRRLQMVARLHRISLNHSCQTLDAGEAIEIDSNNKINVKFDGTNIYLDSQGRLTLALPSTRLVSEYLSIIEDQFPRCKGDNLNMALTSDGASAASWQRVGEYYRTITNTEIDNLVDALFVREEEEEGGEEENNG